MAGDKILSPAELASEEALALMTTCLEEGNSFRLEAGAGAGKTYSLVYALNWLIKNRKIDLARGQQCVACITYTNAAKDEIEERIDYDPVIQVSTIHSFCWNLISKFQRKMCAFVEEMEQWHDKLVEADGVQGRHIEYNLGFRFVTADILSLHHDDIIPLMIAFLENAKFRMLLTAQYPIILIDEYQDTDLNLIDSFKTHYLDNNFGPQFGFFGDHWQKIYGNGCGEISHDSIEKIGKKANFRSVQSIVDRLNKIRPELPQFAEDPDSVGEIKVFHTNSYTGARRGGQGGGHWKGDLPVEEARVAYERVIELLEEKGWNFSPEETKVLMLTHRVLADEQGYPNIVKTFRYRDDFLVPEFPHLKFFKESVEPAREAYLKKQYGEMMEAFSSKLPVLQGAKDKEKWSKMMSKLISFPSQTKIGEILDFMRDSGIPPFPDDLLKLENRFAAFDENADEPIDRQLEELKSFREIAYSEVQALVKFIEGYSPFATKHGVKGLEFENVLIVFGRGWNHYNFGQMLEWVENGVPDDKAQTFERNRNLFYVSCSRAKKRLALLFTQELSDAALSTLENWFGPDNIQPVEMN